MAADARMIDMSDLNDLEPLSKRLNAATDELNQVLESIQSRLNALALGVEAWLDDNEADTLARKASRDGDEEGAGARLLEVVELGYARHADGWAFVVRTVHYRQVNDPRDRNWDYVDDYPAMIGDVKPLLKAARHIRVKAVDRIPKLIDALQAEASKVIAAVEQAKKIADSLK